MSDNLTSQTPKKKQKKPETSPGNLKESENKEDTFMIEMNQWLEGSRTNIFSNKKQSPLGAFKKIERLEIQIPLSKPRINKDEKESKRFESPLPCDKSHKSKFSKDHLSKDSSSSLLGDNNKKLSENNLRTDDIEEDDDEVEPEDDQMKIKINSSVHIKEGTQKYMPSKLEAKVVIRGMAFTKTTHRISEVQKGLVNKIWKANASNTSTYASMKNRMDFFEHDFETLDPNDPDLYGRLEELIDKLASDFNQLVNLGNSRVGKVDQITSKLEKNISLIHQSATDLIDFFNKSKRHLKGYLKVFENAIIENAPKIGIEVRTFNDNILPVKNTKLKLCQKFIVFLVFYGSYLEPYSFGKNMPCFFCSECKCIIFSSVKFVEDQTHLKDKVFSLQFLMNYYDKKRLCDDSYIEKAWDEFKGNVSKGFPNLTHSKKHQFLDNLDMPPLILPGDINKRNKKHECFSKKFHQEMLEKNFIKDKNDLDNVGDQDEDNEDSNDLTNEEDSFEKEITKVKTNTQLNNLPATKEEEIEEKKERELNTEYKDNKDDSVFLDQRENLNEVETSN